MKWDELRPGDVVQDIDGTYLTVTVCYEGHVVAMCADSIVRIHEVNQHRFMKV